ncbi:hypothetical protein LSH36_20g01001 [Paralvinella palmiformis]|uniref:Innexin n=1 Tax=Paralvinella palmiformis TaxID=53620 RepID=A0AAD9NI81_9ANNE|nr:hypothetical protein LSH36_20g01001 [Paralvinella palmiformis]
MVLQWISLITGASERFRRDDNVVDRFHHRYTVILLVVFAVVSTTNQLVGNPITCWAPKEFESGWIKYTNTFCWVQNTYFLPFEYDIPKQHEERQYIVYYQWIPFIFLGMAIFFYMPSVVWTSFNSKAGVDSDNILETAETFRKTDKLDSKDRILRLITNQIDRFVGRVPKTVGGVVVNKRSAFLKKLCCLCGPRFGNYLVVLYIVTKALYIANAFSQLFVLNSVLKSDSPIYGIEAIKYAIQERSFLNHTIFPKVTMCDIQVRALGIDNTRTYTVQCLLPINLYTEKMFVFLWFWIMMVLFLTIADLVSWILRSALPKDRHSFVENSLIVSERIDRSDKGDRNLCVRFVDDYLRGDGVFVLRLIGENTNKITSSEIIASLWDNWREKDEVFGVPKSSDTESEHDLDPVNQDTLPLKPLPPAKPHKLPSYRPNAGPPPPPPPPKPGYPVLPNPGSAPEYPASPPPSAPPVGPYNEYS